MSLQELPEVPAKALTSENLEESLDLPDVPTKPPVASEGVETKAPSASKGYIHQKNLFLLINVTPSISLDEPLKKRMSCKYSEIIDDSINCQNILVFELQLHIHDCTAQTNNSLYTYILDMTLEVKDRTHL